LKLHARELRVARLRPGGAAAATAVTTRLHDDDRPAHFEVLDGAAASSTQNGVSHSLAGAVVERHDDGRP